MLLASSQDGDPVAFAARGTKVESFSDQDPRRQSRQIHASRHCHPFDDPVENIDSFKVQIPTSSARVPLGF